ncbi:MAG: AMP-dependent synthetase, partial [Proteobacteria bacterium]|nr:AMP-dependent synthetase [Pseudomonadota bacterium]
MNISSYLLQSAKKYPDRPIISFGSKPYLSYYKMVSRVKKGAATLRERFKLSPGDHVAIILRNSPFYLEIMYSCWFAGLAVVPVNSKLHAREMAFIIDNATIKLCFTSTELADILDSTSKPEVKFVDVSSKEYQEIFSRDSEIDIQPCRPDDPAWLFYTSGTTGKPKGVVLTHENLEALSVSYFASVDSISPQDSILHVAPMSHASGFYNFPHVYAGANNVVPESGSFDTREIFELTNEWKKTSLFVAPTMLMRMVSWAQTYQPNLEGIKTIIFGGGPMYTNDLLDAKKIFGQRLAQIYAQGESP